MVTRLAGAATRAFLVMVLVAVPSAILPGIGTDTKQMVALVALFAAALTFAEYNATFPGLVEFRDAPPFNRIRYATLFAIVFTLSMVASAKTSDAALPRLFEALAVLIGHALDFPYSPVRLATLMMAEGASPEQMLAVRTAAGTAYILSLIALAFFVLIFKLHGWPGRHQAFNVWVNLPTFEPTAGGDVVDRLERDARANLALGVLLSFLIPAVVSFGSMGFRPLTLTSPQTLIWTMTAWAFLPVSLLMRGIAMGRIASMIREKRAHNEAISGAVAAAH
ncbi:hypothetical protein Q9295_10705 [Xinfangfangia sp. CPCC 101601]|uniref:Uncharacterized protein n=1 Tax=Pseudogemmobacter lacusdianii TaxID=3069608 RepID=A0ABU0VYL0_9RHOB|nr:hypothetical protein [Xinfangfangia sp. CPCC 101601]MDQ2066846.1 hypothetical protein [Xinfangfangia sp. CPCC 101601]